LRVWDEFEKYFSKRHLNSVFEDKVSFSNASGIDNINQYQFRSHLDDEINVIHRKVLSGTYKFTKFKLKLVSKGRGKVPRELSIPTVRDRIALRAMCDFLRSRFKAVVNDQLPQSVIRSVKKDIESGAYTAFIKLDVSNYYPSIKHDQMMLRLRRRIRHDAILGLIHDAIQKPTISISREDDPNSEIGIPQGLSISNVLADIYLSNIDRRLTDQAGISYYRYVDDVLILCRKEESESIAKNVITHFRLLGLKVYDPILNPEKSRIGLLTEPLDYLGYTFRGNEVSVRSGSLDKVKASLASIFTQHKHAKKPNNKFLEWRLNLRITGCVFQHKAKGWIHFYSEINDEALLHRLDHYVATLIKRFDVTIKPKLFVRTFFQLLHNRYDTSYIPNFDAYGLVDMKHVLSNYFGVDLRRYTDEEIKGEFLKRIDRQAKDLLQDIGTFS